MSSTETETRLGRLEKVDLRDVWRTEAADFTQSRTITTAARTAGGAQPTETKQLQFEYWTALRELIQERGGRVEPTKPLPQHWQSFALGRSSFHLSAIANMRDQQIAVKLVLTGDNAKAHFHLLAEQKADIEKQLGEPLDWSEQSERKACYLSLRRHNCDPSDRSSWPEQHDWLYRNLNRFHEVFSTRVKRLNAEAWNPEEPVD